MSLFAPKCSRCGKTRTRHTYQGLPTCESCEQALEARMRAAREERRNCPRDGSEMTKEVALAVILDRCPTCKGVWLDAGELEQIRNAVAAGVTRDFVRAMAYPI
jgi:hypothetical protein